MYSTEAVSRPELSAFLEQAQAREKYYIAQKIFPVKTVKARAGRYPRVDLAGGGLMRREQTKRGSTGAYNETTRKHEWDTYDCVDRGLEERIDDTKAAEMDSFFSLEKMATGNVRGKCLLDFEINASAQLLNPANFPATAAAVAYTEANIETMDVPQDLNAAVEEVTGRGEEVNTIVISSKLWLRIRRSTKLQTYLYGKIGGDVNKRLITPKDLASAFAIDMDGMSIEVLIARAKYDTSNKKATASTLVPIWGTDYIWTGCVKGGEFEEGGAGRTLVWSADVPNGMFATETYRDEKRRSDMARVRTNSIEKIINGNAGQLVTTNYA